MGEISGFMTCQRVLYLMVITGFMFNYMLRVNLTIAIVEMVGTSNKTVDGITNGHMNSTLNNVSSMENMSFPLNTTDEEQLTSGGKYDWDEQIQNLVLGCFFWGYLLTELPGGRLAEVIGARRVFGYSMLSASIITLATPFACRLSYIAVVVLRVLLGFMLGATWPAIQPMAASWIPPMERSKFIANMMASSLGAAITMPICGLLIASLGWESVFYVTGIVGFIWSVLWFMLIFDSPAQHPRIDPEEREYIEKAIKQSGQQGNKPDRVPWKSMLTAPPVWAIIITHGCSVFGYFTVVNQLPTYMKYILHYNIKANGLLSSLPYLGKYLFAVFTSILADHLRSTGRLTTTQTRKIFTTFAVFLPGVLMIGQACLGMYATWSIIFFTAALTVNGGVTAGYLGNGLDIAPNFSGTIFGMANTLSSIGGFLSAYMVGCLTYNNQVFDQWQKVFWILFGVYTIGALTFLIFGTGELQPWNNSPAKEPKNEHALENGAKAIEESVPLKEKATA